MKKESTEIQGKLAALQKDKDKVIFLQGMLI